MLTGGSAALVNSCSVQHDTCRLKNGEDTEDSINIEFRD